jgi:DNA-binding transcriptional ArsR family regulator
MAMKEGPDIAKAAALIGDPVRANMLTALLRTPALTAGELAREGGITPQTASEHLRRLQEGGLLRLIPQGRHRYYALADADVAQHIEMMLGLANHLGHMRTRPGPRDPSLRRARVCYDHMAGEIAVNILDKLRSLGGLDGDDAGFSLTGAGRAALDGLGVEWVTLRPGSRALCRPCLDWSERRPHLAGRAGAAILDRLVALDWVRRVAGSRALAVTSLGEVGFRSLFL